MVFVPDPSTIDGDTEEEPAGLRLEFLGIMETLIKTVRIEQFAETDRLLSQREGQIIKSNSNNEMA